MAEEKKSCKPGEGWALPKIHNMSSTHTTKLGYRVSLLQ